MRFHFTFAELLQLERLIIESERLIQTHPPYADLWIPKAHWILHVPHDIYRFGPSRLLSVFLKEMKNAAFKRGCKRSNFQNPVKSAAEFWCEQSDYQLQQATFDRSACQEPVVLVSFAARDIAGASEPVRLLLERGVVSADAQVDFLSSLAFHGVRLEKSGCVVVACALYRVQRILACSGAHYLWMRLLSSELTHDECGSWSAHVGDQGVTCRLMSLNNGTDITCVYIVPNDASNVVSVIVKL